MPSYGGKQKLCTNKISSINNGDIANHTKFEMSVHLGTHIDFPSHFYKDAKHALSYDADFFVFNKPLFIEIEPKQKVIFEELIEKLDKIEDKSCDILLICTNEEQKRGTIEYECENCGFDARIASYLKDNFPNVRIIGFDTISVSSFTNREAGRVAHKAFLNPENPILLLEDMSLKRLKNKKLKQVVVSPLRLDKADGAPCTVIGVIE